MAIVKMGAIATDIKGKLGGHVFQGSKGGTMIRTKSSNGRLKVKPIRLDASLIERRRMALLAVTSKWQSLNPDIKQQWEQLVGVWTFINKFGEVVNRNAYAIYVAANINLKIVGNNPMLDAPLQDTALPMNHLIELDPGTEDVLLTFQNPEAVGQKFVLEQALPTAKGKQAPTSKYAVIHTGTINDTNPQSIEAFLRGVEQINLFDDDYTLFFRLWTFKENYPKKQGIEKSDIRRGF